MSENSYLRHFSSFSYLTVLRLITTVWPEMSENSYLRHFSAQVSQIVFFALFDRFTVYYNCMTWNVRKLISPPFQCTSITNRFLSLFDHFTAYYNCMTWNVRKLISPPFQCTSITNRVLRLFDRFTAYYNLYDLKCHISPPLNHYNCMTWNVRKLISPPFQCTSITNRVLSLFDRFTAYYNCMTWNVRKLISPPFQCTSITNRVLRLFDRFTAYYNCMTWNVRKLISPPFQCTSITNRVLRLFDRFTALLQLYDLKCQKTHISAISVHKYHKSFS